jgi:hypothetical protein
MKVESKKLFYLLSFFGFFLFVPFSGSAQVVLDCLTDDISVIDYPCVDNVRIVVDDDGLEPGALTFPKAIMVRIHANIKDVEGVKYARVIVKDGPIIKALISLYDDGKTDHGDDGVAINGSSGKGDNVYSALWQIPYSFQSSINYSLILEVANQSGDIYQSELETDLNSDTFEKTFFVDEVCVAGDYPCIPSNFGCNLDILQQCNEDVSTGCSYWQNFENCSPNECCGSLCCDGGETCSSASTCIVCGTTCDGICDDVNCVGDPDCVAGGCCGDTTCNTTTECAFCFEDCGTTDCFGNGDCDQLIGENPINNPGECADNEAPQIFIQSPAFPFNTFYNGDSFQAIALITDNFYTISSFPATYFRIIRDSDGVEVVADSPFNPPLGNVFESNSIYVDPSWQLGNYTIEITSMDTSGNLLTNTVNGSFTVSCINECLTLGTDLFCKSDNLFTQNCEFNPVTGCNIIVDNEDCSTYSNNPPDPNSIGICKLDVGSNPNCCEENCSSGDPSSCVDAIHLSACVQQTDGCFRQEANLNCPTFLSDPGAECKTNALGISDCCINICDPADPTNPRCSGDNSGVEYCVEQANGCYDWEISITCDNLATPEVESCHNGSGGTSCCADEWSIEGTNVACDGFNLQEAAIIPIDGCIGLVTQEDCSTYANVADPASAGICVLDAGSNPNCCEENCNPLTWGGATGIVCDPVNSINYLTCGDLDGNGCNTRQADTCVTGECRNGTMGDNCCSDLCNMGDPYICIGSEVRRCEVNPATGCNNWEALQDDCGSMGQSCFPDLINAYCDVLDTTPPIITLQSQSITPSNWTENDNTTFFSGGNYNNVNSLSGYIALDLWLSGSSFVLDNTWNLNTVLVDSSIIDVSANAGESVALKPVVVVPGYPPQGEYTAYIDGGAGPVYEWDTFAWQGTFPGGTKFNILVDSSATATSAFSSACILNDVTGTGSIDITTCTDSSHRYLHYRVTLFSD